MERQLAINKARMEREARGDYGQCIHLVFSPEERKIRKEAKNAM